MFKAQITHVIKKDPKDLPILMCFSYLSLQIKQAREKISLACF